MNLKRALPLVLGCLVFPAVAAAHPGHDGHEFSWDLGTDPVHQLATLSLLAVPVLLGAWLALRWRRQSKLARISRESRERRG
jgi:hypothetical protein